MESTKKILPPPYKSLALLLTPQSPTALSPLTTLFSPPFTTLTHLPPPYTASLLTAHLSTFLRDLTLLSTACQPTFALFYYQGDGLSNSFDLALLDGTTFNLEDYALSLTHCEHAHVLMIIDPTSQLTPAQASTTREKVRARLTRVRPGRGRVYVHVGEAGELWKVVREAEGVEEVVRRAQMRAVGAHG
jgi:hypothetical protein